MRCSIPENKFQFYLSSIKRIIITNKMGILHISFNSTLVQLKAADYLFGMEGGNKFQFYLSSIKSWAFSQ